MTTARAFIAIEIPEDVVGAIVEGRRELERSLPPARWVRPERMHLTLTFLGGLPLLALEALARALRRELGGVSVPRIVLGGSGFFPNARRARVAWIGGESSDINGVLEALDRAALEVGLAGESQSWSLHLTQARLKRPWPAESVQAFTRWGDALVLEPFDVTDIVVFTSQLQPAGPVYTVFERIRLE